ncbi:MAG: DCC1-like thiol-disulfide oxidoreductase family protein [Verrucomicrobiota bacterium]
MNTLYVLYDAECAFCARCREWLENEPAFVSLEFIPRQSPQAACRFPGIEPWLASGELVVVSDEGAVYCGPEAFILCLYALMDFREWSERLACPALRPFARQIFDFITNNRHAFAHVFVRYTDDQLAGVLRSTPPPVCGKGLAGCALTTGRRLIA